MKKQRHAHPWVLGLGMLALAPGCKGCGEGPASQQAATPPSSIPSGVLQARKGLLPTELMADTTSPYTAGLFVDDEAVYLTTAKMAYRLVPGAKPLPIPVENGGLAVLTRTGLVTWDQEALWKVPKLGGQAQRLAELKLHPTYTAASGDDFAWVVVPAPQKFEIQTVENGRVRTLYFNPGSVEALAMEAGRVYFVQKDEQDSWRIGSVGIRGGDLRFAPPKTGPTPARLVAAGDIYHYDMKSGAIRKISLDLSREEVITDKTICSPLAVADKVYCANMEGVWQLDRQPGAQAESVFPEPRRIPNITANAKFLTWLADTGPDRLSLMMLPLPLPKE